jgi:hypothetical protein
MGRAREALEIQLQLADELRAAGKSDRYVDDEIAALRGRLSEDDATAS